jgi:signal transduction histidine kinase
MTLARRLTQLFLNLVDNAVKSGRSDGSVVLALKKDTAAGSAIFTLTNTGEGLTDEQRTKVFQRFYRGDTAHGSRISGVGLGLSICQWITTSHAGTLTCDSTPGGLTTFTVTLPLAADC